MNSKNTSDNSEFVPYDDNNIEHVLAGNDYGQVNSSSAWNECDSVEYPDYVNEITEQILKFHLVKITKF